MQLLFRWRHKIGYIYIMNGLWLIMAIQISTKWHLLSSLIQFFLVKREIHSHINNEWLYFCIIISSWIPDFKFLVERAKEDSFTFMFKSYTLITSKFTFLFFFCGRRYVFLKCPFADVHINLTFHLSLLLSWHQQLLEIISAIRFPN